MLRVIDSHTNFAMLDCARQAVEVVDRLKAHNVVLPQPFLPFDRHVRVTLGTPSQMQEFWRIWDATLGHHMSM